MIMDCNNEHKHHDNWVCNRLTCRCMLAQYVVVWVINNMYNLRMRKPILNTTCNYCKHGNDTRNECQFWHISGALVFFHCNHLPWPMALHWLSDYIRQSDTTWRHRFFAPSKLTFFWEAVSQFSPVNFSQVLAKSCRLLVQLALLAIVAISWTASNHFYLWFLSMFSMNVYAPRTVCWPSLIQICNQTISKRTQAEFLSTTSQSSDGHHLG